MRTGIVTAWNGQRGLLIDPLSPVLVRFYAADVHSDDRSLLSIGQTVVCERIDDHDDGHTYASGIETATSGFRRFVLSERGTTDGLTIKLNSEVNE
jgi:hypothetical protein